MIEILLDNDHKIFLENPMSIESVRKLVPEYLHKDSVLAQINGELADFFTILDKNSKLSFIKLDDPRALQVLRHDAAHLMAESVKELFPEVQVTIGPAIKDGFYYDFFKKSPFKLSDLDMIEAKMKEIAEKNHKFTKRILSKKEAIEIFKAQKEFFKIDIINSIDQSQELSIYYQGEFFDLCKGPHLISTGSIKYFKLTKLASAYWRGDSSNVSLQRIYGTAWSNKKDLDKYLMFQEEATKRDHRILGKTLSLFHFQHEAQGIAFWHPKGYIIYKLLQEYMRQKLAKYSYVEVKTPVLVDRQLWEKSGHWDKFQDNMFTLVDQKKQYALKPMNCPCHIEIFNKTYTSYKDLPVRMSEFGSCYRREDSGALHGLLRVRNFVQDDAHIFCTEEQINSETVSFYQLLKEVYEDFGFKKIKVKFSDRPQVRAGDDEIWDLAEASLKDAISALGIDYEINPGEGAFYGPKLEFVLKDAIGREWQCGTLQVDFILAKRLNASYIASDGKKRHPIILHRAILGTFERFIGILIEEYAGKFPLWLAPVQISILTVTDKQNKYAQKIFHELKSANFRASIDLDSQKITYKLKKTFLQKIPVIIIIGEQEEQSQNISVRFLGSKQPTQLMLVSDLIKDLNTKVKKYKYLA